MYGRYANKRLRWAPFSLIHVTTIVIVSRICSGGERPSTVDVINVEPDNHPEEWRRTTRYKPDRTGTCWIVDSGASMSPIFMMEYRRALPRIHRCCRFYPVGPCQTHPELLMFRDSGLVAWWTRFTNPRTPAAAVTKARKELRGKPFGGAAGVRRRIHSS